MSFELLQKYDVAVPRYTSYPPVPAWAIPVMDESLWKAEIIDSYDGEKGLSLYIHLPYCEQLCTYCGCNKRITINHNVEMPYIHTVLKEWNSYIKIFGNRIPKSKNYTWVEVLQHFLIPKISKYSSMEFLKMRFGQMMPL
ncbi:MAG: hypothetical protein IPN72_12350 [Saprospiraceae bacterium]|nr:hypothetical protein [Saprospiraceae bacterium]